MPKTAKPLSPGLVKTLKVIAELEAAGVSVTQASVGEKLKKGPSTGWRYLTIAKSKGLVGQRHAAGRSVGGSFHLTPKGKQVLAQNGAGA